MNKKERQARARLAAETLWKPIKTRKMEIIQELYQYHEKALVDWMTETWSVEKLERFLKKVKNGIN